MSKYLRTAESWLVSDVLRWPKESFDCSLWRENFSITSFKHNLLWPSRARACAQSLRATVEEEREGTEGPRNAALWSQAAWVSFSVCLPTCVISVEILDYQGPIYL